MTAILFSLLASWLSLNEIFPLRIHLIQTGLSLLIGGQIDYLSQLNHANDKFLDQLLIVFPFLLQSEVIDAEYVGNILVNVALPIFL